MYEKVLHNLDSYDVRIKIYSDGLLEVRTYDKDIITNKSGLEEINGYEFQDKFIPADSDCIKNTFDKEDNHKKDEFKQIRKDSLARSKNLLVDLAHENYASWHSFITLTFAENVSDLDAANKEFNKYISKIKRVFPDFKYLAVPEFQKRGSVHYHLMTNIICGSDLIPTREKKYILSNKKGRGYSLEFYNLPYWNVGFSSAFDLKLTDDKFSVAAYCCKYLYKDIDDRLYGRQKILHSRNLKLPKIYKCNIDSSLNLFICILLLKYKGIEFSFIPKKKFEIGFHNIKINLSNEDIDMLKTFDII